MTRSATCVGVGAGLLYHDNYAGAPEDGSKAWEEGGCVLRVIRGGSLYVKPGDVRSAHRGRSGPGDWGYDLGFRLAQNVD